METNMYQAINIPHTQININTIKRMGLMEVEHLKHNIKTDLKVSIIKTTDLPFSLIPKNSLSLNERW
jgi:hypothetical protein